MTGAVSRVANPVAEGAVPSPLSDLLSDGAAEASEFPCVTTDDSTTSWAALHDRARAVSAALFGIAPDSGHILATSCENSAELVAALFGAWSTGWAVAPLNPRLTQHERRDVLARLRPTALFVDEGWDEPSGLPTLSTGRHNGIVALQSVGVPDLREPVLVPEEVALILHTSGTTGPPKPVMVRHAAMIKALDSVSGLLGRRRAPRDGDAPKVSHPVIVAFPLSHMAGLFNVLLAIAHGRTTYLMRRFDAAKLADLVERHRLTSIVLNPTMLHMLTVDEDIAGHQLSSLRFVRSVTAPLRASLAEAFIEKFDVPVLNGYGQTETSGEVIGWTLEDFNRFGTTKLGSAGRAHPGVDLCFLDEDLQPVVDGEFGELCVRSSFSMAQEQSRADGGRITPDGFLRTGDVARLDEDGFVWIAGRRSDMIICGGFKVMPEEVEAVVARHPSVSEVMVAGIDDDRLGQAPHAFVILGEDGEDGVDPGLEHDIIALARKELAPYRVPRAIHFVHSLPTNATGKVLRSHASALLKSPKPLDQDSTNAQPH